MNDKIVKMLFAGLFFGAWPILMNRCGLKANIFTVMAVIFTLIFVFPQAFRELDCLYVVDWRFAMGAFVTGTIGVILFNNVASSVSKKEIGYLFVVMAMVQISVPAINSIVMNGGFTSKKILGLCCAFAAAILLG